MLLRDFATLTCHRAFRRRVRHPGKRRWKKRSSDSANQLQPRQARRTEPDDRERRGKSNRRSPDGLASLRGRSLFRGSSRPRRLLEEAGRRHVSRPHSLGGPETGPYDGPKGPWARPRIPRREGGTTPVIERPGACLDPDARASRYARKTVGSRGGCRAKIRGHGDDEVVAMIAPPVVCVPRAVGAARRTSDRQGGLSGGCDGHLAPVELQ
jgi:hypothetical protein